jgi:uncharacterized protein (TIGR02598 family)
MPEKKAFTLIEIIIALAILGIGLVAGMAYLPMSLDASRKATDMIKASMVAQRVIEDIKQSSAGDITQADGFDNGSYASDAYYGEYQYRVIVNPHGSVTAKDITVYVRWTSKGKPVTETFQTKIPKYNPG